jgi:hypothetical protein
MSASARCSDDEAVFSQRRLVASFVPRKRRLAHNLIASVV